MSLSDLSSAPSVGAQLAAVRQAHNMSVGDAAHRLKLTPKQVAAIENDDFTSLGPVFSRGFVRNYARLLQLDPQPLLDAMQTSPADDAEQLAIHNEHIALGNSLSRHWLKISLAILFIVIVLPLLVYQWLRRETTPSGAPPASRVEAPANVAAAPAGVPLTPAFETPLSAPAQQQASPLKAPATPAQSATTPPAGTPGNATIQLKFAQDAWAQVTDAGKQRLASRLYPAGDTVQLSGQPPFAVVIGNAAHVSITYNGKPVDLAPHIQANVARLTIE